MSEFKRQFQTLPTQFITLSTEISEPFVIPNVSPVSPINSPILKSEEIKVDKERSMSLIELN